MARRQGEMKMEWKTGKENPLNAFWMKVNG